jgi:hypothetical protein
MVITCLPHGKRIEEQQDRRVGESTISCKVKINALFRTVEQYVFKP